MRNIWAIYKREMKASFTSPVAYALFTMFLLLNGVFFALMFYSYKEMTFQAMQQQQWGQQIPNINEALFFRFYFTVGIFLMFLAPLVTMRTFAEENRNGTMELIQTLPIRDGEIVFGKYASAFSVLLVILAGTGIYPLVVYGLAEVTYELLPILTGYLGMILLCSTYIGVGIFLSSLTNNQIIAGFLTFGTLFLMVFIGNVGQIPFLTGTWIADTASHISPFSHLGDFVLGVVNTKGLVYYVDMTALSLVLTFLVLQTKRWRG